MKGKLELKKIKKNFKVNNKSFCKSNHLYKNYILISNSYSLITERQAESLRKYISRRLDKKRKKSNFLNLNHKSFKKASKSRMGKGKGKFYKFYGQVKPGMIIFEFSEYFDIISVLKKFSSIKSKLPFKCLIINKNIFFNLQKCPYTQKN